MSPGSDGGEKENKLVSDSPDAMSVATVEDVPNGSHVRESDSDDGQEADAEEDGSSVASESGGVDGEAHAEVETDGDSKGESEDESEDEEGDEDDEEDDEEPALKYERLGGSVHDLLVKDAASALAYSRNRLVRALLIHRG